MEDSKIKIIDSTLREGNQAPLVNFSPEQSVSIAKTLQNLDIDTIEVGHPYASDAEMQRVKAVTTLGLKSNILSHARAKKEDIQAVYKSGANWVGIFAGINAISQKVRFNNKNLSEIMSLIETNIYYAKSLNLKVRYTVEDSSRTDIYTLIKAYETAIYAGADRICFADTVGILEPKDTYKIISILVSLFKTIPIEVHFHDDRGLAIANALAAIEAGATWISCSVNGLGERCGIPDTCIIIANLFYKGIIKNINLKNLKNVSTIVSSITNSLPDPRRPIIGEHAFTHKAKLHIDASKKDKSAYSWLSVHNLDIEQKINRHSEIIEIIQ